MNKFDHCPQCGEIMSFVSGPIDDESPAPDFVYCRDCYLGGYEPGTHRIVVNFVKW